MNTEQAQVLERLVSEYRERKALAQGEVPAGTSRRPVFFAGKRRRLPWK